jgi:hypothetical protein
MLPLTNAASVSADSDQGDPRPAWALWLAIAMALLLIGGWVIGEVRRTRT